MSTTIVEAYSGAVVTSQIWLTIATIGLLVYMELTSSSLESLRRIFLKLRESLLPVSALLTVLFLIIAALKAWSILG
jgi:hypothetical protein